MTASRAAGYPDMKASGYIMDVFAEAVRAQLYAKTCLPQISESGYLGKIKDKGQTITIATAPRISSGPYDRGMVTPIESKAEDALVLKVDRARYWNQFWDRLDIHQTHLKMLQPETAKGAASQLSADIEAEFFAEAPTFAHAKNTGANAGIKSGIYSLGTAAAPVQVTKKNVMAYIGQFFSVMAEHNISDGDGGKSVVIPEWMRWYLVNTTELKDASQSGEKSSLRTNRVGNLWGIEVYTSTLLTPVDGANPAWPIFACTKKSLNFVIALNEVKVVEPYNMHGSLTKGIVLYDWGNVRSEGIAAGYAYAGDSTILAAT